MTEALAYDIEKAVEVDTLEAFEPLWDIRRSRLNVGLPPLIRPRPEGCRRSQFDPLPTFEQSIALAFVQG